MNNLPFIILKKLKEIMYMGKKIFGVIFILFQGAFFTFILMMSIYDMKVIPIIQEKNRKIF